VLVESMSWRESGPEFSGFPAKWGKRRENDSYLVYSRIIILSGLKLMLVDAKTLDFCIEGRIGDAQLSGSAGRP